MKFVTGLTAIAVGCLSAGCFGRSISINVTADGATPAPQAPPTVQQAAATAPAPVASPQAVAAAPAQPAPVAPASAPVPVASAPAPVPVSSGGSNGSTYVVRTNDGNGVNVRASNSAQSAKVAGLAEGARVIVQGGDRSGAWLEITASNNVRGWVAAQFLQPAGQSTASAPQYSANTLYVKTLDGNGVNLRAEPSLNGRIVTTLKDRTAVTFRESVGQWSYVTTSNGMVGYIASSYLVGP